MVLRHVATPLHTPAARHSHAHTITELLRLRHAADAFASASSFFREGGAELLRRTQVTAPMYHPSLPGPPAWGCFTAPPFQLNVAAEALLGMLFANLFWVGLWDLLDNTIFPNDTTAQMTLLMVAGVVGLYVTDSLYDPPQERLPAPARSQPAEDGIRMRRRFGSSASLASDAEDEEGERLPLTGGGPGCAFDEDDVVDAPCIPPRLELRRLCERVIANIASVLLWTARSTLGIWNQIEAKLLPQMCSEDACDDACDSYGEFPCAWYKIAFACFGLVGQFYTRGLYNDNEVTYMRRDAGLAEQCTACGWQSHDDGAAART